MTVKAPEARHKVIGPYEVLDKLGEGGMGSVYKARHKRTGEVVAVKIVKPDVAACELDCKRFDREFRVAHNLNHPNIVRALDRGVADGAPFLVMEFVDGESLADRIDREGRLSEKDAVPIILQIAEALQAAHEKKVIHRDVKPSNILLTHEGQAKLTDLGLVKAVDAGVELTQVGTWLGTPNFMAPEQFADAKDVDARSDVYALGATLYMAITGEVPFRGRKNVFLNILKKKLQNEITPAAQLVPGLSQRVDFAIRRAVRAERKQRQASCAEFIGSLRNAPAADAAVARAPKDAPFHDRRAAVRFQCDLDTSCHPLERIKGEAWAAKVQDISKTGVRLTAKRRFERGTPLLVILRGHENSITRTFLVRAVRVQSNPDKTWTIGCQFTSPLSDLELKALV